MTQLARMKIAIIDSGVHPGHPHVGEIAGGVGFSSDGETSDIIDLLGHGTAVAGAIRERAPDAEIYIVKIFQRRLAANITAVIHALEWCRQQHMDLVNLSLGTANPAHRERLLEAVGEDLIVVSPANALPGNLPGVIGVLPDSDCPRDEFYYRGGVFYASPYPRPIPGVPVQHNLQGASFAVANMTGLTARLRPRGSRMAIREALISMATRA